MRPQNTPSANLPLAPSKGRAQRPAWPRAVASVAALLAGSCGGTQAQQLPPALPLEVVKPQPEPQRWLAKGGERLSAVIEQAWAQGEPNGFGQQRLPWALRWHSLSESHIQAQQLAALRARFQSQVQPLIGVVPAPWATHAGPKPPAETAAFGQVWALHWLNWLQSWQATGRVFLPVQDPRLMQLHPRWDPVLQAGDELLWPPVPQGAGEPRLVKLLTGDGQVCAVPHEPALAVADVVMKCGHGSASLSSGAWLVQTDGRVVGNAGLAHEREALASAPPPSVVPGDGEPALARQKAQPGAWLWLPHVARRAPVATRATASIALNEVQLRALWPLAHAQLLAQLLAAQHPGLALPLQTAGLAVPPKPDGAAWAAVGPASSTSTWGTTGALQTPTARALSAGSAGFAISRATPYTHFTFLLQPAAWLQASMRYSRIQGRLYGPEIAGDRAYLDKSLEFKFSLQDETAASPAVALGLRDPLGTGLFEGEYLVASKAFESKALGALDAHVGLGWGTFGAAGNWANPLKLLGARMGTRQASTVGEGGTARLNSLFTGRVSPFAGLQWQPVGRRFWLKAEWDGNDYHQEPAGEYRFKPRSRLNVGAVWPVAGLNLHLGLERGQVLSLGVSWAEDLSRLAYAPALARQAAPELPSLEQVLAERARRQAQPAAGQPVLARLGWEDAISPTVASAHSAPAVESAPSAAKPASLPPAAWPLPGPLTQLLLTEVQAQTGWWAQDLRQPQAQRWLLQVERAGGTQVRDRLEAIAELLHAAAPPQVQVFEVQATVMGVEVSRFEIDRADFVRARNQWLPPHQRAAWLRRADEPGESTASTVAVAGLDRPQAPSAQARQSGANHVPQALVWSVVPGWQHNLGGPDGPLYAISAKAAAHWPLWQGAWAHGQVALRLADNYGHYRYTAPSNLPRVRTYLREYQTEARLTVPNAQVNQLWRLGQGTWALAYAGLLEPVFAGAGAEMLHRPAHGFWSDWAFGVDLNSVQQREFAQRLALRDYKVVTGHLSAQWNTGWHGMQLFAQAGRYLAGDVGATLNLSRTFANGLRMGLWATKTRVSARAFGEGSFDKGVYVSLPMELLTGRPNNGYATAVWQPLIRDGGARLNKAQSLWGLTPLREPLALQYANPASAP